MKGDNYHRHLERKENGEELWHRHELGEVNHDHDDLPNYYPSYGDDGQYVTMYWWSWIIMLLTAIGMIAVMWVFVWAFMAVVS